MTLVSASFLNSLLFLLPAVLLKNVMAAIAFVPYPEGGTCQDMVFPGDVQESVCITAGTLYSPSPGMVGDETFYFGQQGEAFEFYYGENGIATDEHIATVRVGFDYPNTTECFVMVNEVDCCSCVSCLDEEENLVGMQADCTNVPKGRQVVECENLSGFFPFDLSLDGETRECVAKQEDLPNTIDTEDSFSQSGDVTDEQSSSTNADNDIMKSSARLSSFIALLFSLVLGLPF